jgi:putative tryptophan/tyrosine transport system substrate-binding protein
MQRREFITLLGAAAAWPLDALAQQNGQVRRIGILEIGQETDRALRARWDAMREGIAKLGWTEGRNVRFDFRFSADDPDRMRAHADELVRLGPDVIAVASGPATQALLQRTRTIPIVFTMVGDPVAVGLLKDLARPEGNVTGITNQYQSFGSKWLELLKETAPRTVRVALIFAPGMVNDQYFAVIDAAAEGLAVKAMRTPYRNATELERAIDTFAAEPNGGLVMVPPPPSGSNRELLNRLAAKYQLPTIYPSKPGVAEGGLMSYGSDSVEAYRIAASYVDRILRGAKIGDLPVQFPTKFELVINLKTAKALGLTIPETLLATADELIQ